MELLTRIEGIRIPVCGSRAHAIRVSQIDDGLLQPITPYSRRERPGGMHDRQRARTVRHLYGVSSSGYPTHRERRGHTEEGYATARFSVAVLGIVSAFSNLTAAGPTPALLGGFESLRVWRAVGATHTAAKRRGEQRDDRTSTGMLGQTTIG